ncbi:MAG: phosphoglycerate mutase family protein [Bdellovibrionota bacterium]
MKLVLLRHATRSPYDGGDSALSTKGLAQAEALVGQVSPQGSLPAPTRLISSPKRRAKQTLTPLSHALHVSLEIEERLDERRQVETGKEFQQRIDGLLEELSNESTHEACVWLCTHLDWLETAMIAMTHDLSEIEASIGFNTAEYKVFRLEDGIWKSKAKGHVP